jgi:transposase
LALGHLHDGKPVSEVAGIVRLTSKAVREIGRRYEDAGLDQALYDKSRPGAAPVLEENDKQRIIAMVCSVPPEGRARWTVRLVAEEAVKRKLVPKVGREAIRILLLHHDLKPWREKNVVRGRTQ